MNNRRWQDLISCRKRYSNHLHHLKQNSYFDRHRRISGRNSFRLTRQRQKRPTHFVHEDKASLRNQTAAPSEPPRNEEARLWPMSATYHQISHPRLVATESMDLTILWNLYLQQSHVLSAAKLESNSRNHPRQRSDAIGSNHQHPVSKDIQQRSRPMGDTF